MNIGIEVSIMLFIAYEWLKIAQAAAGRNKCATIDSILYSRHYLNLGTTYPSLNRL